ncbi:alternative oxidase [Diplocarpon rosae]|nr:alternative oxidase [Diplocarpon rosae]
MAAWSTSQRLLKSIIPAVLLVLVLTYLNYSSLRIAFAHHIWTKEVGEVEEIQVEDIPDARVKFIQDAARWEIEGPFDDAPLRQLCSSKEWTPGLTFRCDDAFGGVGNIRNMFLTCIRYAIEAGATGVVVPQIKTRDADLKDLTSGLTRPFSYMFDEEFFASSLAAACPQIEVIRSNLFHEPASKIAMTPRDLSPNRRLSRVMDFAPEWRTLFDKWLAETGAPGAEVGSSPIFVSIHPSWFEWPILYDDPKFIATFGRILRLDSTILQLAGTTLYALNDKYNLSLEAGKTGVPVRGKFYGAHLRTASDAVAANFASYDEQSSAYLEEAAEKKLGTIYLASGSPPDIERFTVAAAERGINVTTKAMLLGEDPVYADTLKAIESLTWDQQALIDFIILLRSSHFGGTWASSFAYNIAFKRHVAAGGGTWLPSDLAREIGVTTRSEKLKEGHTFQDTVNTIFGARGQGLWFEMSMWP